MNPQNQSPDEENRVKNKGTGDEYVKCSARGCNKNGTDKVPFKITITGEIGFMRVCREHYEWILANTGNDGHHEGHEELEE